MSESIDVYHRFLKALKLFIQNNVSLATCLTWLDINTDMLIRPELLAILSDSLLAATPGDVAIHFVPVGACFAGLVLSLESHLYLHR